MRFRRRVGGRKASGKFGRSVGDKRGRVQRYGRDRKPRKQMIPKSLFGCIRQHVRGAELGGCLAWEESEEGFFRNRSLLPCAVRRISPTPSTSSPAVHTTTTRWSSDYGVTLVLATRATRRPNLLPALALGSILPAPVSGLSLTVEATFLTFASTTISLLHFFRNVERETYLLTTTSTTIKTQSSYP